jgi:hypothetical protein
MDAHFRHIQTYSMYFISHKWHSKIAVECERFVFLNMTLLLILDSLEKKLAPMIYSYVNMYVEVRKFSST